MPQHIEVPGQGVLEFPDSMAEDQIKDVIKRKFFSGQPSPDQGPIPTAGGQAPPDLASVLSRVPVLKQTLPPTFNPATRGMVPLPQSNIFMDSVIPANVYQTPETAVQGLYNTLVKGLSGVTSPFGAALGMALPIPGAGTVAKGLVAGLGAKSLGEVAGEMAGRQRATTGQTIESLGDLAQSGLMALAGYPEFARPEVAQPRPVQAQRPGPAPVVPTETRQPVVARGPTATGVEPGATVQLSPIRQRTWDQELPEVKAEVARSGVPVTNENMFQLLREAKQRLTQKIWGQTPTTQAPPQPSAPPTPPTLPPPVIPHAGAPAQQQEQQRPAVPTSPTITKPVTSYGQESQRGIQGGIPQGQVPQPGVQVQGGGTEAPQAGGVLQAPQEVGERVPAIRITKQDGSSFVVTGRAHALASVEALNRDPFLLEKAERGEIKLESGWQTAGGEFTTEKSGGAAERIEQRRLESPGPEMADIEKAAGVSQADLEAQLAGELGPQEEPGRRREFVNLRPVVEYQGKKFYGKVHNEAIVEAARQGVQIPDEDQYRRFEDMSTGQTYNRIEAGRLARVPMVESPYLHSEDLLRAAGEEIPKTSTEPLLTDVQRRELMRQRLQGKVRETLRPQEEPQGPTRRRAGANLERGLDIFGESMYDKVYPQTAVKEMIQNSFDAVKRTQNPEIKLHLDPDKNEIGISDNGTGMTPDLVVDKLLPAFESGKEAVEGAGGYGLAKIALLGRPDEFEIKTVADVGGGRKMMTEVTGTGKSWRRYVQTGADLPENLNQPGLYLLADAGGEHLLEMRVSEVGPETQTGTDMRVRPPAEKFNQWDARRAFRTIARNELSGIKFTDESGVEMERAPESKVPVQKSVNLPSADIEIRFDPSATPGAVYNIPVMNRGLHQFDHYFSRDVKMPQVTINIIPKVDVKSESYPFTNNRDALKGETKAAVLKEIDELANTYKQKVIGKFQERMSAQTKIKGSQQRFLDISGKMDKEKVEAVTTNPIVMLLNKAFNKAHKSSFDYLNQRYGDYWKDAKFAGFANGGSFLGVRFGTPIKGSPGEIYYDLQHLMNETAIGIREGRYTPEEAGLAFGEITSGVMLHELAHQISSYEGETHAVAMTGLAGRLARQMTQLTKNLETIFTQHAKFDKFHEWYQSQIEGAKITESEASDIIRQGQSEKEKGQPGTQPFGAAGAGDVEAGGGPESRVPSADKQRYDELTAKMREALGKKDFQSFYEMQKETEAIKNRHQGFVPKEEPSRSAPDLNMQSFGQRLSDFGLKPGQTAHDAVSSIANYPDIHGTYLADLGKFLLDNYEHVLRTAQIDPGTGRSTRANYDPITHTVHLAEGRSSSSMANRILEEATHAATYWQFEHPRTETQLQAVRDIQQIREASTARLADSVREKIGKSKEGLAYRHSSDQEFIAGLIADPELRQHLNSFTMEGPQGPRTAWERFKGAVKRLLGIKPKTALDQAFDALTDVGTEREGPNAARATFNLDPVSAPAGGTGAVVHDATTGEAFDRAKGVLRGQAYPGHSSADQEVANKLVRYASARIAAPETAKWMATDVLGKFYKDPTFDKLLGATLVEDRLRAVKAEFSRLAAASTDPVEQAQLHLKAAAVTSIIGKPDSPFRTEAQFQRALTQREISAAIERHKAIVQPYAQQMHERLGGELAALGENTDAFVNLRAIFAPESVETARGMIFGSRKGELTNPLRRGSTFSKRTEGTAEAYDLSYRNIAERMIRGNYEQVALQDYYNDLVAKGLAVEEKPGVEPPKTEKGEPLEKITIEIKGGAPGRTRWKNLWVRKDLAPELRQALAVDKIGPVALIEPLMKAATTLQIAGLTDITWHTINQLGTIGGMQGAGKVWYDVLRKAGAAPVPGIGTISPIGTLDAVVRLSYHALRAMMDTPQFQKEISELSQIGAGRAKPQHQGLTIAGRQIPGLSQLNRFTSSIIRITDKAGRVAANNMFDELVRRGWVQDKEEVRREFINSMGQYNGRMMGQIQALARDSSLSSFVVAGTTMNRNALRRLLGSPLVQAADSESWAKMRLIELGGLVSLLYAIPAVFNTIYTGQPHGRPGTPWGGIDTGKPKNPDGTHEYVDPLQMVLLRRGLRISGTQALERGLEEQSGVRRTLGQMIADIFQGLVHPWSGPAVRTLYTAATGREIGSGYLVSKNPTDTAQNIVAALKNLNPMVAGWFRGQETGKGGIESVKSLRGAVGIKQSRHPTIQEEAQERAGGTYENLSIPAKRRIVKDVLSARKERPVDEVARRSAGERAYWESYQLEDDLKSSLPPEQQEFLQKNNLTLRGFKSELDVGGVHLPSDKQTKDFMFQQVAENYQKQVARLMKSESFHSLPASKKQTRLDELLAVARNRARAALRRRLASLGYRTTDRDPFGPDSSEQSVNQE